MNRPMGVAMGIPGAMRPLLWAGGQEPDEQLMTFDPQGSTIKYAPHINST